MAFQSYRKSGSIGGEGIPPVSRTAWIPEQWGNIELLPHWPFLAEYWTDQENIKVFEIGPDTGGVYRRRKYLHYIPRRDGRKSCIISMDCRAREDEQDYRIDVVLLGFADLHP